MATYAVDVEEADGRWEVYVPSLPGCMVEGATRQTAEAAAPAAIRNYLAWRRRHGDERAVDDPSPAIVVQELAREWRYPEDPRDTVNAFFATDAPPLGEGDVDELLQLLQWSRDDLAGALAGLPEAALEWDPGDGWTMGHIAEHVGRAEWWYLDRIGLAPSGDVDPGSGLARLNIGREQLYGVLPMLVDVAGVVERQGELWSPRKVLRRALCHERDHTAQILALRKRWVEDQDGEGQ